MNGTSFHKIPDFKQKHEIVIYNGMKGTRLPDLKNNKNTMNILMNLKQDHSLPSIKGENGTIEGT